MEAPPSNLAEHLQDHPISTAGEAETFLQELLEALEAYERIKAIYPAAGRAIA